eukprot:30916-Pelagococcus_subviridis.AAC.11
MSSPRQGVRLLPPPWLSPVSSQPPPRLDATSAASSAPGRREGALDVRPASNVVAPSPSSSARLETAPSDAHASNPDAKRFAVLDFPYCSPGARLPRAFKDVAIVWGGGSSFGTAAISSKIPASGKVLSYLRTKVLSYRR